MMRVYALIFALPVLAFAKAEKPKAEVTEKKLSFDTGKKDKKGKAIRREFPVMFDIASKAKAAKSKRTHAPKR